MNDAASLDRLHDIITPAAVPWWPLAVGWYTLGGFALLLVLFFGAKYWRHWRHNAYRREALRALKGASNAASIGVILRRTALAESPRAEIAALHGNAWAEWLVARSPEPMTPAVREQLLTDSYVPAPSSDPSALRAWAARWIAGHRCQIS